MPPGGLAVNKLSNNYQHPLCRGRGSSSVPHSPARDSVAVLFYLAPLVSRLRQCFQGPHASGNRCNSCNSSLRVPQTLLAAGPLRELWNLPSSPQSLKMESLLYHTHSILAWTKLPASHLPSGSPAGPPTTAWLHQGNHDGKSLEHRAGGCPQGTSFPQLPLYCSKPPHHQSTVPLE